MTANHVIILILIEVFIAYLAIYTLNKAIRWTAKTQLFLEQASDDVCDFMRSFRAEVRKFNENKFKKDEVLPLSYYESGILAGELVSVFLKPKLPILGLGKNIAMINAAIKLWKYRHRIIATFTRLNAQ